MKFFNLFILIAFCLSFLLACDKNEDTVNPLAIDQCRNAKIKRVVNLDGNGEEFLIDSYTYDGDKIIQIDKNYTKPLFGAFNERHIISYPENKVNYIIETDSEGEFVPAGKYEIISQDDVVIESTWFNYDNGQYVEAKKTFYEYDNSKLTAVNVFFNISGEFVQKGKVDISYVNDDIENFLIYNLNENDEWLLSARRKYMYENGRLANWVFSMRNDDGNWEDISKWIFHYSNGMISEIEKLETYFGAWEQSFPPTNYFYDSSKRLIKTTSGSAATIGEYVEGSVDRTYLSSPEDKLFFEPQF